MKYYSTVLKKIFDTAEELEAEEAALVAKSNKQTELLKVCEHQLDVISEEYDKLITIIAELIENDVPSSVIMKLVSKFADKINMLYKI